MPSPYRPRAWEDRGLKGKARSFRSFDDDDDDNTEGEIPDVVFGVAEVPWRGKKPAPAAAAGVVLQQQQQQGEGDS
ncbi:hypothetical protein EW145_g950 [Phellinidium pouzarii]|uniref:Uncharacterized protein n=1 Tax=Phellinidium pouzarii TaxID=167371 RepID=A0A4V3XDU0_9AGAM|nr:hypothetical protein EW145_g950 [Phellinidium pouzarii]